MHIDLERAEIPTTARHAPVRGLFRAARPKQWSKNVLLFFGLIFALKLTHPRLLAISVAAFVIFCAVSSAIYLINDLADVEKDRRHPIKRNRPLASGQITATEATVAAMVLLAATIPLAFSLNWKFGILVVTYIALQTGYSFALKHLVLLDVFALAAGFVIRAAAGAVVIDVPISPWLYVCTILGSLFLGLSKRRHELILLADGAAEHRRILQEYTPALLDQLIVIVTSSTVMAYSLYTFSAENLPRNHAMMATIPFVLYGTFRYLYLIHLKDAGGSPEEVLLRDRPLLINIALWLSTAVAILYLFR
ncbi:MAG: decaprenyl-phosphate phosphoribosyltransferase [Chloroflexi bacterium]|nr:decaprenyl-phosphate phosphoribosyltransferase [Chloroflexota bacterium]